MLGVFTSGLTQQYIIGGSGARQLATLKRYLKQNNVAGPKTDFFGWFKPFEC